MSYKQANIEVHLPKPNTRLTAQYTRHALTLFGQLIRESRLNKALTTTELAERAGISRSLLQRIERGDPGCAIGAVFETAAICGVPLFEPDARTLASRLVRQKERLALMPKAVRAPRRAYNSTLTDGVNDDF